MFDMYEPCLRLLSACSQGIAISKLQNQIAVKQGLTSYVLAHFPTPLCNLVCNLLSFDDYVVHYSFASSCNKTTDFNSQFMKVIRAHHLFISFGCNSVKTQNIKLQIFLHHAFRFLQELSCFAFDRMSFVSWLPASILQCSNLADFLLCLEFRCFCYCALFSLSK